MKFRLLLALALSLVMIASCSKKQEDADKLEKEMIGNLGDTVVDTVQVTDTVETVVEVAEVPEEPTIDPMPKRPAGNGFTVQVAACEDEAYARYLVDLYTKRGYEPFVSEFTVEGQKFYRVRIGVFENMSEAKSLTVELADKFTLTTWVDYIEF